MEPLSKTWHALESTTTALDDEADLTIQDLLNLVQQTVLLVGQTNNTISYYRQLGALVGVMKSSSQAKSLIKDKSALLENSGKEFFVEDFRDQITDIVKALKQSKELLFNSLPASPFWKAPHKVSFIAGGKTLASSEEAMIAVPEKGSTVAGSKHRCQVRRFQAPGSRDRVPGAMDQVPGVRD